MDKFTKLQEILDEMKPDTHKFYEKEQNAAGTRLRKSLNDLKKAASDIRREIQEIRTSRKNK